MDNTNLPPIEVMWTPARLASYIGVTVQTVLRWVKTGVIRDARKMGRVVRIPQSEVQRIMNERKENIITKASQK